MKLTDLQNKRILIAGYGIEGKATERFLKKYAPNSSIYIADDALNPDLFHEHHTFDIVIKSPGIPKEKITHKTYTTATNMFFANIKNKTIGITGTKGKSTTASLIAHALNACGKTAHLGGNIGKPLLDILSLPPKPDDFIVCELSSYQLADIQYSPDISVIINLFPDHIPYHHTLERYYEAKKNILTHATADSFFVYNPDFPSLSNWAQTFLGTAIPYPDDISLDMNEYPLRGHHNKDNIRATIAVTRILGLPDDKVLSSLRSFHPLPHRLQYVGTFHDILFYDDAISTTPESTIAALRSLDNVKTLFLGGEDRGYDFSSLVQEIKQKKIPYFVLFPDTGQQIYEEMRRQNYHPQAILETSSMKEAVAFAYENTPPSSLCLLSTASPSYSIWKNFEEKGTQYHHYIHSYAKNNASIQKK